MIPSPPPPFVQVLRGGLMESIHRGHMALVRPDGALIDSLGDPEFPTYLRSAAKPFQAIPVVELGVAEKFGLTVEELALMCGSVSGQDFHVAAVASVLDKIGLDESYLNCGVHRPSHHRDDPRRPDRRGRLLDRRLPPHGACAVRAASCAGARPGSGCRRRTDRTDRPRFLVRRPDRPGRRAPGHCRCPDTASTSHRRCRPPR